MLGKCIVIFIIVLLIILLCAACRNNENKTLPIPRPIQPSRYAVCRDNDFKTLPVQTSRIEFATEKVVKKENKTIPVQPRRVGKSKVLAFFKKIRLFLFPKKTKTPNSYFLESQMTTKIQSSVATIDNTIVV